MVVVGIVLGDVFSFFLLPIWFGGIPLIFAAAFAVEALLDRRRTRWLRDELRDRERQPRRF